MDLDMVQVVIGVLVLILAGAGWLAFRILQGPEDQDKFIVNDPYAD
jgi:hypothetical protein